MSEVSEPDLNYSCSYCSAPEGVECDANCVSHRLRKAEVGRMRAERNLSVAKEALERIAKAEGSPSERAIEALAEIKAESNER